MKIIVSATLLYLFAASSYFWRVFCAGSSFEVFVIWFAVPAVGLLVAAQFVQRWRMNIMFIHADIDQPVKRNVLLVGAYALIALPLLWPENHGNC